MEWIRIEDGNLPVNSNETVIGYSPKWSYPYVDLVYYDNGTWFHSDSDDEIDNGTITHYAEITTP